MGTPPRAYFGRWLKVQLATAGRSAADLGRALGVREMTVSYWATSPKKPGPAMAMRITALPAIPAEAMRAALAQDGADMMATVPILVAPDSPRAPVSVLAPGGAPLFKTAAQAKMLDSWGALSNFRDGSVAGDRQQRGQDDTVSNTL